jgi:hypothetical protein
MKRTSANIAVFCLASAATAWVWHARFPMADLQPPAPGQPHSSSRRVESIDTRAWLADLASARSAQAKLDVARQLDRIPANQVRAALEETPLIENGQLSMAARLLLIRWAAQDGEQAIEWAWMRFRSESVWHDAFREIIAAWSWNQPAKLADWAAHVALSQTPNSTYIPLAEAQQSEHPILDTDALRTIVVRLMRTSPRDAVAFLHSPGGARVWDSDAIRNLQSVTAVHEALSAFDDLEALNWDLMRDSAAQTTMRISSNQAEPETIALALLQRWRELDAEDFARSRFAALLPLR